MLCDNDELEVHASHKHGVHCKYFQCKKGFCCFLFHTGQTKVMQIRQGEMLNHQGAIAHEVCCLAAQLSKRCTCAAHGTTSKCQEYSGKII